MAIFSAFNLIRAMSAFHMTLSYFLLNAPKKIADQNLVFLLGEAMRISEPTGFAKPSSATAIAAVFLAFWAVSDVLAVSMDEDVAFPYWANQIPTRLLFLFGITSYSYFFKPSGLAFAPGPGDFLKNRVVFTWGFFECTMWFWAYIRMREEKFEFAKRLFERRKKEAAALRDD
ncbi:increased loss of mitochondrial DNA protein 1 [Phyllosticta citribraziliensis]|uniref:Increased loss of mitochondrial DNA protein 1 n=1 Tax=Phyllosticta citribraziliensis TaxID=989973 RepID=A0ABR1M402_9PEZI